MAIRINAETLRTNANSIKGYRTEHDNNIKAITNLINSMCNSEVFDGATASAYKAQLDSMQATMTSFSEMLENFATQLERIANNFEDTDNSLASSMGM